MRLFDQGVLALALVALVPSVKSDGRFENEKYVVSGAFVRHVLPAAIKPIHSLWHEVLGFTFLVFAGIGAWKVWQHPGALPPIQFAIVIVFIAVMTGYGISSIRKARRISRS